MTIEYKDSKRIIGLQEDKNGATASQGNNGGSGLGGDNTNTGGGGGGGAGAAGVNAANSAAGNGGDGLQSDITGTNTYYAGGGGGGTWANISGDPPGGTGGSGGGGNGGEHYDNPGTQTAGTANTGGGGGAAGITDGTTKAGGSGVVILQFTTSGTSYSTTGSPTVDTSSVSGKTVLKYTGSGTFVLSSGSPDVRYLVVGGGGGGAGGAGYSSSTGTQLGSNGENSSFAGVVASGGGGGANNNISAPAGADGGSGGGGGGRHGGDGGSTVDGTTVSVTIPTNVQDNSLFVTKDTARRYWFTAESENTKTVDENFDSTGLLTWTELHSANIGVDSSTNERLDFDFKRDGTNDTAYHQLSSALSDSAWVMDFDLTFSTLAQTGGSDAICGFIGVAASYEADNSDSHDGMYLQIVESNTKNRFQVTAQNNSTLVGQAVSEGTQFTSTTPSTTTFYVRLIRNGNDLTGQFFSTSARTGTATEEKTQTISGITGLSYITIKNLDFSGGSVGSNAVAGYIDNLKIYDGVTSTTAPATWTMQPTRFDLSTSTGWTTTGSNCSVDTTGEYLEGSSSTNDDRATKALGITLSDTKFVIRQKMELVTVTSSGNYGQLYFGYTDKDNSTTVLGNRDGIGITIRTTPDMLQSHADGQAWQTTATLSTTPASSTTYYLELIRNSSTSITLNLYSDSDYSTLVETKTNTIASTIVGLNHITIGGWDNSSGGVITARFSNIEIYNGVTSIN